MTESFCPTCHTAIPSGAPGGFCPACVLRGAEETASTSKTGGPALGAVQAAFPDLEIEALIGQGGMGFVYKARQPSLDRTVALKILAPGLSADPAFAERFAREARVLGKLNHPNIVTVHGHGVSGGFYYLIMEYVDGVNLRQAMRTERFSPAQALSVVPGICDALQAAHAQGIWHRDIKPENILLDSRGQVKIVDFGIARLVGDPQRDFTLTVTGAALGSAVYMAPEQHEKPHDVDHRADIYSLGVVLYEMLTGELPLGRFPAPSQRAEVHARIDEIVLRTLEKERALRQQSAEEVKTDVAGASCLPLPQPPLPKPPRARARRTFLSIAAAASAAAMVVWGGLQLQPKKPPAALTAGEPMKQAGVGENVPAVAPSPPGPVTALPSPAPTARAPAKAVPAPQDVLAVFRTMNRLANERDLTTFQTYSPQRRVLITGDAPLAEKMRNFTGEPLRLHLVSQQETRPAPIGFGVMLGSAEVVALMKASDGTSVWRQYRFQKKEEEWKYIHLASLQWKSTALVEFPPAKTDSGAVLRAHLDESLTLEADEGGADRFRLGTTSIGDPPYGPDQAKFLLEVKLKSLEESLKKSGFEGTLKILSPPGIPDEPVHLPDPPATGAPPQKTATAPVPVPVPVPETARLQTIETIENGVRTVKTQFITDKGEVFPSLAAANAALNPPPSPEPGEGKPAQAPPAEPLTGTPRLEKWSGSGCVAFLAHCGPSPMFALLGKGSSTAHQLHSTGSRIALSSHCDFNGLSIHFSVSRPETATIAGRTFDLSKGRVFTMAAQGIRQFPLECPLELTDTTMRELLEKTGTGDPAGTGR